MEATPVWVPLPGPQSEAYHSPADILFYGGAAGGGKTDLAIGLCLTSHCKSIIFRREGVQLQGIIDRLTEINKGRDGYNGQEKIWRIGDKQIEFGACKDPGDETKYQGRPHDLAVFDEITHFLEQQVRFLLGWIRSTKSGQRKRVLFTGNPPTDSNGQWVVKFFAPWLDKQHPDYPEKPGKLRWYAMIDGKEIERPDGTPFQHDGKEIKPQSRTFIPSRVQDNPYLMATDYEAQLQSLPEPLRSQMLHGDFCAGTDDDPYQAIPTEWVVQAQARWKLQDRPDIMDSIGLDVARGGKDETVIACRYERWFAPLICYPGSSTPDGSTTASLAFANVKDRAPIHVDIIGVGSSVYDHLNDNGVHVVAVNGSEASFATDRSGRLRFVNKRAEIIWKLREALDPKTGDLLALPPGNDILADLTAPKWKLTTRGIQIESKDDIKKRIGRSPDKGDAIAYAYISTMKLDEYETENQDYYEGRSSYGGY